jgi:NTP pyrophosphatase (non-canonical NTP hydrolase)
MDEQEAVAAFVAEHDLEAPPAYRLLDLVSEVGELAKEAAESTDYGGEPAGLAVAEDELGDALFALLALAESLDADAGAALAVALEKYERRLSETGDPGSESGSDG